MLFTAKLTPPTPTPTPPCVELSLHISCCLVYFITWFSRKALVLDCLQTHWFFRSAFIFSERMFGFWNGAGVIFWQGLNHLNKSHRSHFDPLHAVSATFVFISSARSGEYCSCFCSFIFFFFWISNCRLFIENEWEKLGILQKSFGVCQLKTLKMKGIKVKFCKGLWQTFI